MWGFIRCMQRSVRSCEIRAGILLSAKASQDLLDIFPRRLIRFGGAKPGKAMGIFSSALGLKCPNMRHRIVCLYARKCSQHFGHFFFLCVLRT